MEWLKSIAQEWVSVLLLPIVIALLAAAVLYLGRLGLGWLRSRYRTHLASRRTVRKVNATVTSAYARHGLRDRLFVPASLPEAGPLPILTDESGAVIAPIDFESDGMLAFPVEEREETATVRQAFPASRRLTFFNWAAGITFADNPVLYVDAIERDPGSGFRISARLAGYRAAKTLTRAVRRRLELDDGPVAWRDISSFERVREAIGTTLRPVTIGSDVVCVFRDGDEFVLPVHRRSDRTIDAPGAHTAVPAYTYETNRIGRFTSRFGIIAHNFLREFLEEFWDQEVVANQRSNPDWVFETEQGRRLLREVEEGRVRLHCVGVGFDLTSSCLSIALAAVFDSEEFLRYVTSAPGSWEAASASSSGPAIEFYRLYGGEGSERTALDELLLRGEMKPTTAFAIDGARRLLDPRLGGFDRSRGKVRGRFRSELRALLRR